MDHAPDHSRAGIFLPAHLFPQMTHVPLLGAYIQTEKHKALQKYASIHIFALVGVYIVMLTSSMLRTTLTQSMKFEWLAVYVSGYPLSVCLVSRIACLLKVTFDVDGPYSSDGPLMGKGITNFVKSIEIEISNGTNICTHTELEGIKCGAYLNAEVGYVGRTSFTQEVDVTQKLPNDEKLTAHVQFGQVAVDMETRKPAPLPDGLRRLKQDKYSLPDRPKITKDDKVFIQKSVISEDYLDENGHANYSTNIVLLFQSLQSAFQRDTFPKPQPSPGQLKKFTIFYDQEGKLGDSLTIATWEGYSHKLEERIFHNTIENGHGQMLSEAVLTFSTKTRDSKL